MPDNIKLLSKIPQITEITRIRLSPKIEEILGERLAKLARKNNKQIYAYKITYKSNGKKIKGFIVEPRRGEKLPCIIWNRGGNRDFGTIKIGQLFLNKPQIAPLAIEGYIMIMTQYPGVAGGEGTDQLGGDEDTQAILDLKKIINKYQRANKEKVGMMGGSRGGKATLQCLKKVKWIKAAAIQAPSIDITKAKQFRPKMIKLYKELFGNKKEELIKRSPIYWVEKLPKKTPLLIAHGSADWRTNPQDTIKFAEKLYINKIPYKLIIYPGDDHQLSENKKHYTKEVIDWFNKFLKNDEEIPNMKPHGK